jgi:hypothetical protein
MHQNGIGFKISIAWITAHAGVDGNERVKQEAESEDFLPFLSSRQTFSHWPDLKYVLNSKRSEIKVT